MRGYPAYKVTDTQVLTNGNVAANRDDARSGPLVHQPCLRAHWCRQAQHEELVMPLSPEPCHLAWGAGLQSSCGQR